MKKKSNDFDLDFDDEEDIKEEDDGFGAEIDGDDDLFGGIDDADTRQPMNKYNDLLKDLTNFSPYLKDCVNSWLGLVWNEEKKMYVRDPQLKPIMNYQGASWCIGFVKTYTRQNNILTHIGKEEYESIMSDIIENIWLNIGTRAEEFGINNDGDILRICNEIEHAAELVLMGAGDGKYSQFLGTTIHRNENINPMQNNGLPNRPVVAKNPGTLDRIKRVFFGT